MHLRYFICEIPLHPKTTIIIIIIICAKGFEAVLAVCVPFWQFCFACAGVVQCPAIRTMMTPSTMPLKVLTQSKLHCLAKARCLVSSLPLSAVMSFHCHSACCVLEGLVVHTACALLARIADAKPRLSRAAAQQARWKRQAQEKLTETRRVAPVVPCCSHHAHT